MKMSIALATYNGSKWIKDQLDSFNCQIKLPFELVVCDDCSTDNTVKIIEEYKKIAKFPIRIFVNGKNIGYTRNFERALSICNGDLICLSDQDDVWNENKLMVILSVYKDNPNFDVFVNNADYVDESLNLSGLSIVGKAKALGASERANTAGACTTITKRFRDAVLPFPNSNCPAHDTYIHRWGELVNSRYVLSDSLQKYRIHNANNSNTELSNFKLESSFAIYKKYKYVNSKLHYKKRSLEYLEMKCIFCEREKLFTSLPMVLSNDQINLKIKNIIDACKNRSVLYDLKWLKRIVLITKMILKGQYQYFNGFKSIIKDILI